MVERRCSGGMVGFGPDVLAHAAILSRAKVLVSGVR